ncbi:TAXI family TRAP transporter solute-binding subunit [Usitatibacter palustris]|uniref:TRAP transporter solute receptor, TAXI family n=1 Tax=Usitatibacter palustris TaxID=2732487 RepID=A0A6M4H5U9_9PROT|nr:TAXI family TRAP transporter solute-binding subunit [Usitatibacter palustris]QJR14318.1 hypothetical protein DSM104440_01114 [Usitatibacter palustris]
MRILAALLVATLVAACGGGPDSDALKKDVVARVGEAMPEGLVSIQDIHRRGSQNDVKAPAGETRRVIYFDADLKLAKDYDFGAWDSPGVAGLVSGFGTGPRGLSGITTGGNKAGDVIRAHGSAIYKKEGDKWSPVAPQGYRAVAAPEVGSGGPRPTPEKLIEAMKKSIETAPPETSALAREVIAEELESAHAAIRARLARASEGYAIAAGPLNGQYLRFIQAFPAARARTVALITPGGEENLRMLRDGRVVLAMSQSDAALDALEGKGSFAQDGAYPSLRAVGALYPEAVHVLVRNDSPIKSFSELRGKRVAIGVPGAASRTTAIAVLAAHDIGLKDLGKAAELPLGDALVALRQKEVDAVIQVIGFPADSVRDAAAAVPLRLVPLEERVVRAMAAKSPAYFELTLPKGTYASQATNVRTVATSAILAVGPDMTDLEVAAITRVVYGRGADLVARGSAQGAQLSAANARRGLAVPQHTAAARAIEEMAKP